MKNKTILLILLSFIFFNSNAQNEDTKSILEEKLPRKAKEYIKEMAFIPMGVFNTSYFPLSYYMGEDSTLVFDHQPLTIVIQPFYMSRKEVTNHQYKAFLSWSLKRKAMDILAENDDALRDENGRYKEEVPIDWNHKLLKEKLFINDSVINMDSITYSFSVIDFYGEEEYEIRNNYLCVSPDNSVWESVLSFYHPIVNLYFSPEDYFNHEAFNEYPVVGVSYLQAEAYCHWLTNQFYQEYFIAKKALKKKSYYFDVYEFLNSEAGKPYLDFEFPQFRLPTEREWEYAALGGEDFVSFPWGSDKVFSKEGLPMANFAEIRDENGIVILTDAMTVEFDDITTSACGSYEPNGYGLYDMAGNVSEWCSTKFSWEDIFLTNDHNLYWEDRENHNRVVKGGSWADGLIYQLIAAKTIHNETEKSCKIGFRVVISY